MSLLETAGSMARKSNEPNPGFLSLQGSSGRDLDLVTLDDGDIECLAVDASAWMATTGLLTVLELGPRPNHGSAARFCCLLRSSPRGREFFFLSHRADNVAVSPYFSLIYSMMSKLKSFVTVGGF